MTSSTGDPDRPAIDARFGQGIQVGDNNTQHIHLPAAVGGSAVVTAIHTELGTEAFVGREPELEGLAALLAPGASGPFTGLVQGMGGIGKTALVRRAAAHAVGQGWFCGGAVFVDLRGYELVEAGRVRPGQVFAAALRALGVSAEAIPSDAAQQPAAYHGYLDAMAARDERVLVVLDNAADLDQVQDLLPTSMAARVHRVLITSRDTLPLRGVSQMSLGVLAPVEATELLRAVLDEGARDRGEPADLRAATETGAVAEVVRWCGRLPQAVVIAAGVLVEEPDLTVDELAADLADSRTRLAVLDDGAGGVPAAFLASWLRLRARDREAARLLCLLTITPGPDTGLPAAAAVLNADETVTRVKLRVLTRAHLLLGGPRRWEFHDLLRLAVTRYAVTDLGITEADLAAATDRVLDHYVARAKAAVQWMPTVHSRPPSLPDGPFDDRDSAVAWLEAERACLVAAVAAAEQTSRDRQAVELATVLTGFLSWRRHVADWVAVAEIVYQAVRRLRDVRGTVKGLVNLGAALIEAGRFEEAARNLNTALLAGRINFDSLDIDGRILDDVGLALQELGDFEGALWRHNYATELFQELGDRRSEAAARNNAGIVLERLGAHVQAIEAHSAAVETFRGIGDRLGEAMALGNLAIALRGFGNRGEAIDVFAAARTAFEECGDRRSVGQTWRNVGVIDHEAGWLADAVTAFVAAALIFEKIGDWRSGTQMWREVERIYTAAGRPDDARFAAERAMPETEANGLEDRILGVEGWRIHTIYWGEFG